MKRGDPVSAPRCQGLSSQNAVWGQGQGLGMVLLDDYKINAASWPLHKAHSPPKRPPQSPCQLRPGGSQTGTLKERGISRPRHLKGGLHLKDQRHAGSRALVTLASLVGIPHKRVWAGDLLRCISQRSPKKNKKPNNTTPKHPFVPGHKGGSRAWRVMQGDRNESKERCQVLREHL